MIERAPYKIKWETKNKADPSKQFGSRILQPNQYRNLKKKIELKNEQSQALDRDQRKKSKLKNKKSEKHYRLKKQHKVKGSKRGRPKSLIKQSLGTYESQIMQGSLVFARSCRSKASLISAQQVQQITKFMDSVNTRNDQLVFLEGEVLYYYHQSQKIDVFMGLEMMLEDEQLQVIQDNRKTLLQITPRQPCLLWIQVIEEINSSTPQKPEGTQLQTKYLSHRSMITSNDLAQLMQSTIHQKQQTQYAQQTNQHDKQRIKTYLQLLQTTLGKYSAPKQSQRYSYQKSKFKESAVRNLYVYFKKLIMKANQFRKQELQSLYKGKRQQVLKFKRSKRLNRQLQDEQYAVSIRCQLIDLAVENPTQNDRKSSKQQKQKRKRTEKEEGFQPAYIQFDLFQAPQSQFHYPSSSLVLSASQYTKHLLQLAHIQLQNYNKKKNRVNLLVQKMKLQCQLTIEHNQKLFREILMKNIAKILIQINFYLKQVKEKRKKKYKGVTTVSNRQQQPVINERNQQAQQQQNNQQLNYNRNVGRKMPLNNNAQTKKVHKSAPQGQSDPDLQETTKISKKKGQQNQDQEDQIFTQFNHTKQYPAQQIQGWFNVVLKEWGLKVQYHEQIQEERLLIRQSIAKVKLQEKSMEKQRSVQKPVQSVEQTGKKKRGRKPKPKTQAFKSLVSGWRKQMLCDNDQQQSQQLSDTQKYFQSFVKAQSKSASRPKVESSIKQQPHHAAQGKINSQFQDWNDDDQHSKRYGGGRRNKLMQAKFKQQQDEYESEYQFYIQNRKVKLNGAKSQNCLVKTQQQNENPNPGHKQNLDKLFQFHRNDPFFSCNLQSQPQTNNNLSFEYSRQSRNASGTCIQIQEQSQPMQSPLNRCPNNVQRNAKNNPSISNFQTIQLSQQEQVRVDSSMVRRNRKNPISQNQKQEVIQIKEEIPEDRQVREGGNYPLLQNKFINLSEQELRLYKQIKQKQFDKKYFGPGNTIKSGRIPSEFNTDIKNYHFFSVIQSQGAFRKIGGHSYQVMPMRFIFPSKGEFHITWKITFTEKSNFLFGVIHQIKEGEDSSVFNHSYYAYRVHDMHVKGNLMFDQPQEWQQKVKKIKPPKTGDLITMVVNMEQFTIEWKLKDDKRVYASIPSQLRNVRLTAFAGIYRQGDALQVVQQRIS